VIVTIPNLISVIRLVAAPAIIWLVIDGAYVFAFWLFLAAGLADAADGYIARRFKLASELGAYLDPLADKILLISLYVVLAATKSDEMPIWLAILVVSRDLLIMGAVVLSWMLDKPLTMRPLVVSKANTVAQIVLVVVVLANLAFGGHFEEVRIGLVVLVGVLTASSATAYFIAWFRHMSLA
jgi:cardiolipin synthase